MTGGMRQTVMNWLTRNYVDVMRELEKTTREQDINKQELVLELDFRAVNGVAPALKQPPEFKIGIAKQYFEGDRVAEPDWFFKGTDGYEDNVKPFRLGLQDHHNRMTDSHVLIIVRHPVDGAGVYRVQLASCEDGSKPMLFSDQALEAYSRVLSPSRRFCESAHCHLLSQGPNKHGRCDTTLAQNHRAFDG